MRNMKVLSVYNPLEDLTQYIFYVCVRARCTNVIIHNIQSRLNKADRYNSINDALKPVSRNKFRFALTRSERRGDNRVSPRLRGLGDKNYDKLTRSVLWLETIIGSLDTVLRAVLFIVGIYAQYRFKFTSRYFTNLSLVTEN